MSVQCSHEPCRCEIGEQRLAQGAKYCSDLCAAETDEVVCACGHAGCSHVSPQAKRNESVTTLGEQYSRE